MARPKSTLRTRIEQLEPGMIIDHPATGNPTWIKLNAQRLTWEVGKKKDRWYVTRTHGDVVQIARVL